MSKRKQQQRMKHNRGLFTKEQRNVMHAMIVSNTIRRELELPQTIALLLHGFLGSLAKQGVTFEIGEHLLPSPTLQKPQ